MDNFQLKTRTVSASYSSELEKQSVNERIQLLSETAGREFTTFKDVFEYCLQKALEEQTPVNTDFQPYINELIQVIGYEEVPENTEVLKDVLEIINTPVPTPTPVEVIKEVEKPLTPQQVLLNLSPGQLEIVQTIARWRVFKSKDQIRKTPEQVILDMVFNKTVLTNDHGAFETGLRLNAVTGKLKTQE